MNLELKFEFMMCLKNKRINTIYRVVGSFLSEDSSAGMHIIKYASNPLLKMSGIFLSSSDPGKDGSKGGWRRAELESFRQFKA